MSLEAVSGKKDGKVDPPTEATMRGAILTEFSKMPNDLLQATAAHAREMRDYGRLHLASIENNSRDQKHPAWAPISLEGVELPGQQAALAAIREGQGQQLFLENIWRAAEGRKVDLSSQVTAARLMGATS
jgi:hypothetical protein